MPLSPTGQYTLPNGYLAVTGQDILPSNHNPPLEDIANVLSEAFYRTGVAPMLANLNFNNFRGINVADGINNNDTVNIGQLNGAVTAPTANSIVFTIADKMIQFGAIAVTTGPTGGGVVTFPTAFSVNPPKTIIAINGNWVAQPNTSIIVGPLDSNTAFTYLTNPVLVSQAIQVNWIAIGDKT